MQKKWTAEDWAAWRAENMRLMQDGWVCGTDQMLDGTVVSYAEKDGVRIDRTPNFERDDDGNYIYGAP